MLNNAIVEQLRTILGNSGVLTGKMNLATYSYDATADLPRGTPEVIVLPSSVSRCRP